MTVVSARSIIYFYIQILLLFVFATVFIAFAGYIIFTITSDDFPIKCLGALLLLLTAFCLLTAIYKIIKNTPAVVADEKTIKFNNTIKYWKDISRITLTGKQEFDFILFPAKTRV